ncbi:MAG: hypothetical protein LBC11_00310, partial [Puniceicoccales bacterium]|nr:hypothetical protein [Puniceicoccales bacterium]
AVKTALNTISGFIELSGISSSIANVLSIIEAVAAINAYGANKSDANLAMVKTELNAISGLSETSVFSITAIIGEIDTYSNVKGEIESARTAIATFKSTKNKTNLEAVVSKLQDVKSVLTGSYDIQSLKAAIDGAITETSGIRTRLNDLTAAIASYNGLTSLTAAPAAFQEVKRAFQAFSDRDIQTKFNNSTISNLSDRVNGCIQKIDAIATFDDFYGDLSNLLAICQNGEIKALLSPADQNLYYGSGTSLKEPLTYADLSSLCNILSGHLNTISTNLNAKKSVFDSAVEALNKQLSGVDPNANINDLLNLCMMASTPKPLDNGSYRLVTGIQRTVDSNGNYTYALIYGGTTIDKAAYEASFSKEDAYKQYSLPYLALAIMYEKVGIQQMVLVEQLKQVEKINEAISENNKLLKALSWLYEKAYGQCINPDAREWYWIDDSELKGSTGFTFLQLNGRLGQTNLNNIYCMYDNRFQMAVNSYDRNGDPVGSGSGSSSSGDSKDDSSSSTPSASEVQNIDVKEQATLTMLSNKQDSVRINGDQLSTNSQLMTTKMSQYMQNSNACVSAATQVVKSIGDYLKTMTSNVR